MSQHDDAGICVQGMAVQCAPSPWKHVTIMSGLRIVQIQSNWVSSKSSPKALVK